jgi:glutamate/tyrosine decarboxylase-like PLP-dependent enzyme
MNMQELNQAIELDLRNGLSPWMIAATAGTTDTGAIDPLHDIHQLAKKHNIWLHIDAAYGGFFMLAKQGKLLLDGLHLADSIVMDAHKALFMPYGIAFVLIKDKDSLLQAHRYTANILQDTLPENEIYSPANLSPELTRPFRGLRLWLSLQLLGVKYFRMALEEKMLLAQYFYNKVSAIKNIDAYAPTLSIVIFRYLSPQVDSDLFNYTLHQELLRDGTIFLSSTRINGNYYLRFACLSFRSHLQNVELAIDVLNKAINKVSEQFNNGLQ